MRISDWSSDVCSSDLLAFSLARPSAGRSMPARIAIMAMTTSSSMSVKPAENRNRFDLVGARFQRGRRQLGLNRDDFMRRTFILKTAVRIHRSKQRKRRWREFHWFLAAFCIHRVGGELDSLLASSSSSVFVIFVCLLLNLTAVFRFMEIGSGLPGNRVESTPI